MLGKFYVQFVTSWKLAENFAKLSKGCFLRSHTSGAKYEGGPIST